MEDENETRENHSTQVTREADYRLVNVNDGFLNLMTVDGVPEDDVRVPEGRMGIEIPDGFEDGGNLTGDDDTVLGFKIVKHG